MTKSGKFIKFLDTLKTSENVKLLESVKQGFRAVVENIDYAPRADSEEDKMENCTDCGQPLDGVGYYSSREAGEWQYEGTDENDMNIYLWIGTGKCGGCVDKYGAMQYRAVYPGRSDRVVVPDNQPRLADASGMPALQYPSKSRKE